VRRGEDSLGPVRRAEKGWSRVGGRGTSHDHPSPARRRGNPAGTVWGKRFCQPSGAESHFLDFRQRPNDKATAMPRSKPTQTRKIQIKRASGFALFQPFRRHRAAGDEIVKRGNDDVRITFRIGAVFASIFAVSLNGRSVIAPTRDEDVA
jgi:hypothetical protein